jgi:hypothetical protein
MSERPTYSVKANSPMLNGSYILIKTQIATDRCGLVAFSGCSVSPEQPGFMKREEVGELRQSLYFKRKAL